MAVVSSRAKFFFHNSMVCLLKALENKYVTVELRNDLVLNGKLEIVESTMNLNMSDVCLTNTRGEIMKFSKFFVKGRQIRFVKIPDEIDIVKAMEWELNKTEYFKQKERKAMRDMFQRRQNIRNKRAAKLNKHQTHK